MSPKEPDIAVKAPPVFSDDELKLPSEDRPTSHSPAKSHRGIRAILIVLTLALLVILVGLYYWQQMLLDEDTATVSQRPTAEQNREPESNTARAQTDATATMSTSDELTAIEADLNSTDITSLDTEINAIEAELDGAQ